MAKHRIFQIAKELNISHTEILSFLKDRGIQVGSHMAPVDEESYNIILAEFHKDKESIERYRKEQVRREIHDTRIKEQQKANKKLKLLSLDEQRKLEVEEKKSAEIEKKRRDEEAKIRAAKEKEKAELEADLKVKKETERKEQLEKQVKLEADRKKQEAKIPKKKLRRIDLSEIEAAVGKGTTRRRTDQKIKPEPKSPKSAVETVRKITAKIDTKAKKKSYKKEKDFQQGEEQEVEVKPIKIAEFSSVDEVSKIFNTKPNDVIQKCMGLGVLATINQRLDWDVIELLAEEFEFAAEKLEDIGDDLFIIEDSKEDIEKAVSRSPIVTVMGHVDHGKTSLLDYIRETNVVGGESGGITQHIGAHKVELKDGNSVTFLDTPGHEAFTAMRARGAQVTDMVVLVVAANDGVMPQTVEAIDHAKAANVPLIIAINKIDLPDMDPERVKRELSEHNVLVEDWGGKIQAIPISAKTGQGVDDLLASMLIEAEMLELKANRDTLARGTVVDSKLDKGHGPIATVLIQKGTLKVGNPFICNNISGKVRAMMNERGQRIKEAGPSDPIQILGFDQVPQSADIFAVVEDEREIKRIASERQRLKREIDQKKIAAQSLDAMSALIKEGAIKNLSIIIKGDVDGSIEALSEQLEKIANDEVGVQVIHKAVGMVSESDVLLAAASNAVIIGFHVQVSSNAKLQAKQEGVDIRSYNVIYNAVEEVTLALEGLLEPELVEEVLGRAIVQAAFKIPKIGFIAGSKVMEGTVVRNAKARVLREEEEIAAGEITSLKHLKDDAKEIREGFECGIGINNFSKFKEGDIIVCYEIKTIKRTLEIS
ncbi:MAG: translation initiation factor IF-2 [Candidatus Marinimicrobia bacterium]|jgi:translation initiation factor IF-2|nr:translation initiation factor IF-2 [Candidatus Neomarinimicrobiota bacterium]MDP6611069.1 translation initiation factor IF-2 [Candidatus Neomarinimicrobiota bacterium]|tara:strand:+ start:25197 stop:27668 length:2472 start_codon:yes stop_codon:yes gene_type:complete